MARERLLPLEENSVSRAIFVVYKPALRWVLAHKGTFLNASHCGRFDRTHHLVGL